MSEYLDILKCYICNDIIIGRYCYNHITKRAYCFNHLENYLKEEKMENKEQERKVQMLELANEATSKLVASVASKILRSDSMEDFTLEEAKAVAGSCLTQVLK